MELVADAAVQVLVGSAWLLLLILIGQRWMDLTLPPLGPLVLRILVINLVITTIDLLLGIVSPWLGGIAAFLVLCTFLIRWFDCDLIGLVILVILDRFLCVVLIWSLI